MDARNENHWWDIKNLDISPLDWFGICSYISIEFYKKFLDDNVKAPQSRLIVNISEWNECESVFFYCLSVHLFVDCQAIIEKFLFRVILIKTCLAIVQHFFAMICTDLYNEIIPRYFNFQCQAKSQKAKRKMNETKPESPAIFRKHTVAKTIKRKNN